jgi:hypothetical protein
MSFEEPIRWHRLYTGAALAGAGAGLFVALGIFPATPDQVIAWVRSFDDHLIGLIAAMLFGAVIGLTLTAVAHLGVRWQLRRRSGPGSDRP